MDSCARSGLTTGPRPQRRDGGSCWTTSRANWGMVIRLPPEVPEGGGLQPAAAAAGLLAACLRGLRNMIMFLPSRLGGCWISAFSSRSLAMR